MFKIKLNVYVLLTVCIAAFFIIAATASATPAHQNSISVAAYNTHSISAVPIYYNHYYSYYSRPHYYRFGHYPYRYHYRYPGYRPHNYGFFRHHLPLHYFYPKYDHSNDYYRPSILGKTYSTRPVPQVNYVIGNGSATKTESNDIIIRIVSRIEPKGEIDAQTAQGKLMLESGDYEAASKYFLKAMVLSPGSVEARVLYARACAADGRWAAASFAFKRAIARDVNMEHITAILAEGTSEIAATKLALRSYIEGKTADNSAMFVYGMLCAADGHGYEAKIVFARLRARQAGCRETAIVCDWLQTRFPAKPLNT